MPTPNPQTAVLIAGGRVFDLTKSYDAMWWISVALGVISALLNWPIKERPVARIEAARVPSKA